MALNSLQRCDNWIAMNSNPRLSHSYVSPHTQVRCIGALCRAPGVQTFNRKEENNNFMKKTK